MSVPDDIAANLPGDGRILPWLDRVDELNFSYDPSVDGSSGDALSGLNAEFPTANDVMEKWNVLITDPDERLVFPRTWDDFIAALGGGSPTSGPTYNGFYNEYKQIIAVTVGDDWNSLTNVDLSDQFVASFNRFMETFRFETNGDAGPPADFVKKWEHFMTVSSLQFTVNETGDYDNVSSYQRIFKAFFPDASAQEYKDFLSNFVDTIINDPSNKNHYFLPSQFLEHYYIAVQQKYLATQLGADSMMGNHGPRLAIIWKVFALVVSMIGVIQKVASVYADRLSKLSQWDTAYTNLIADIPVFTVGDSSPFSGDSSDDATERQELNNKNQTLSQNLQGYRSLVESTEKGVQSNVNNLNDSVNSQSDLATSLLQEMQTILNAIFH